MTRTAAINGNVAHLRAVTGSGAPWGWSLVGEVVRVVEIEAAASYDLRRRVLRDSWVGAEVAFPEDEAPGALHLGVIDDDNILLAVASFSPEATPYRPTARAAKLRGMAVEPTAQGAGVGRRLLAAGVERLRVEGFEILWANGRDTALGFYRRLGWRVMGAGFHNANGIPHHVIMRELVPRPWQCRVMHSLWEELLWRGLVHQTTDPELARRLDDDRVTAYVGFDPTASSLGVGNLLQLCTLRRLQERGHRPIALAGGGTGSIGDPGGKSEERPLLTSEQLQANLTGIRPQLGRFLDFDAGALLLDNGEWLWKLGLLEFLRDVGKHFTVNTMVAKETVRARLDAEERSISYTEFSYMLLQAYDFLHLFDTHGCRLQLGGSDQWGNIVMGVDLIRRVRGAQSFGLTTPLVVKADGTKFGKTEAGNVWLDPNRTSPYQFFQAFVRTDDAVVGQYLRFFTWLDRPRIEELETATADHPERREAQRVLAREVTALVHGQSESARAEQAASLLFSAEIASLDEKTLLELFAEAPSTNLPRSRFDDSGMELVDALVRTSMAPSRSAARTTIQQGGAYVNNVRETDPDRRLGLDDLLMDRYLVLRKGKRHHHMVCVE
jgi:tyrosyl-tRNA synthetase